MATATETFFTDLARRERTPTLGQARGTIRFDLIAGASTDRWLIDMDAGAVRVAHAEQIGDDDADCVVRLGRGVFDKVVTGEVNAMAAMLRGTLTVEGDAGLLVPFQRLLPAPPAPDGEVGAA